MKRLLNNPILLLFIVPLLWSGNFIVGKAVAQTLPPLALSAGRWLIAAMILVPLTYYREGFPRIERRHWMPLLIIGVTGVLLYNTLIYWALRHTTTINATLVNSAIPYVTILLSMIFLQEKVTGRQLWGSLLTVVGIVWILSRGSLEMLLSLSLNLGDLVVLLDTAVWAVFTVVSRKLMKEWSPLAVTTYGVLVGLAGLIPLAVWEASYYPPWKLDASVLLVLLYVGVFASVLAMVWWNKGIQMIGPSRAAIFPNLMPLYTSILAVVFLGETLTVFQLVGGLLIIGGVILGVLPAQAPTVQKPSL